MMKMTTLKGNLRKRVGGSASHSSPFGISYEMCPLLKDRVPDAKGRQVALYSITTYYTYKLKLPQYMVEFLTNGMNVGLKQQMVQVLKGRLLKVTSHEHETRVFKCQIDSVTGDMIVSCEAKLTYSRDALLDFGATVYAMYAEWRDDIVKEYQLNIYRFCGRPLKRLKNS